MEATYISLFLLFFVLFYITKRKKLFLKQIIKSKNKKERICMLNLAKSFINKDCLIYLFENSVHGVIKEISDSAILILKSDGTTEVINADFIVRIREYPKKKNGKNKAVIFD